MSATKPTFPLYGYERFFTMSPETSAILAHVLTVRGDIPTLLTHLPTAVLATFNQHPKMRASLLPGATPQKAMICAPLVDIAELKEPLYRVEWHEREEEDTSEWIKTVEKLCATPWPREREMPYRVLVLADKTTQRFARIVLLADHYMADSTSGSIILSTMLDNAAKASQQTLLTTGNELPLRPSLYECMHSVNYFMGIFHEAMAKWVLAPIAQFDQSGYKPLLAVDNATQQSFEGRPPAHANPSAAFFAAGNANNMKKALERCEAEGVSLQGALTAATMLAFGMAKTNGRLSSLTEPLRLKTDVECDLRGVFNASTFAEDTVGLYSAPGSLVFTSSEGMDVNASFWDVARVAEQEYLSVLDGHELKFQSMFVHETLHAGHDESSLNVPNCVLSDATLAPVGVYPYPQEVALQKDKSTTTLHIESLHVYNALPSLSSANMLFLSGVLAFNYSMMSKLETPLAKELFHWYVQCVENLGAFTPTDTFLQAGDRLDAAEAGEPVAPVTPVKAEE
ncbi:hypothetical protein Poli38472_004817 [Pythium oligandrum]|uniref:Condensation domain-containing protein n=1 Tax=Pythium oligandrum TaxID=41045 RepID=A0A8K1CB47_PYTOL|nr:hypothetical protein Poli38472_004817 [Pythium oligandrum]|eukprot:TMW59748.1 hypothetical protein Poli38472_004817 [Pythium oligandrum]